MIFYKTYIWWWSQVYNIFKEYEDKINFKIVKVMKFMSKTKYSHLLLSITSNDKFWRPHLGQNPNVFKSNQLHVVIFWCFFFTRIKLKCFS